MFTGPLLKYVGILQFQISSAGSVRLIEMRGTGQFSSALLLSHPLNRILSNGNLPLLYKNNPGVSFAMETNSLVWLASFSLRQRYGGPAPFAFVKS